MYQHGCLAVGLKEDKQDPRQETLSVQRQSRQLSAKS